MTFLGGSIRKPRAWGSAPGVRFVRGDGLSVPSIHRAKPLIGGIWPTVRELALALADADCYRAGLTRPQSDVVAHPSERGVMARNARRCGWCVTTLTATMV